MSISNSSSTTALLAATGSMPDSTEANRQIGATTANIDRSATQGSGDFWSMLATNMSANGAEAETEATDLTTNLTEFDEVVLATAGASEQQLPQQEMQLLESRLGELLSLDPDAQGLSNAIGLSSDLLKQGNLPADIEQALMKLVESLKAIDAEIAGQELPAQRQSLSGMEAAVANAVQLLREAVSRPRSVQPAPVTVSAAQPAILNGNKALTAQADAVVPAAEAEATLLTDQAVIQSKRKADQAEAMLLKDSPALKTAAAGVEAPPGARVLESASLLQSAMAGLNSAAPTSSNSPTSVTLPTLALSPNAGQQQWGTALGERVALIINQKINAAELRLDPPHLGKLDIQIQIKDDGASVLIQTQHLQTRDLVDSASLRLREFLQEAGYQSVDVSVSHRDASSSQGELARGGSGDAGMDAELVEQDISEAGLHQQTYLVDHSGRIDFFA